MMACPKCHATFAHDPERDELVCTDPGCGLAYRVDGDGIPIMLIDEARSTRGVDPRSPRRERG